MIFEFEPTVKPSAWEDVMNFYHERAPLGSNAAIDALRWIVLIFRHSKRSFVKVRSQTEFGNETNAGVWERDY